MPLCYLKGFYVGMLMLLGGAKFLMNTKFAKKIFGSQNYVKKLTEIKKYIYTWEYFDMPRIQL